MAHHNRDAVLRAGREHGVLNEAALFKLLTGKTGLRESENSWTLHNLKYVHFWTLNLYTVPV